MTVALCGQSIDCGNQNDCAFLQHLDIMSDVPVEAYHLARLKSGAPYPGIFLDFCFMASIESVDFNLLVWPWNSSWSAVHKPGPAVTSWDGPD